uniref:Uncharacterized protein n=1 Tax=Vespula pensylvanica TaxID=30213 RepID=A0A834KKU0_VESPE|nr:hypothetical protein H0235_014290 [Vespula pensylvanica]
MVMMIKMEERGSYGGHKSSLGGHASEIPSLCYWWTTVVKWLINFALGSTEEWEGNGGGGVGGVGGVGDVEDSVGINVDMGRNDVDTQQY